MRHHETPNEYQDRNGAERKEKGGREAVLCSGSAHGNYFKRAQAGGDEGEGADPLRQRAPGLEKIFAGLDIRPHRQADGQGAEQAKQEDQPVGRG